MAQRGLPSNGPFISNTPSLKSTNANTHTLQQPDQYKYNQPEPIKGYFTVKATVGMPQSSDILALIDSGAMPSLLCRSVLPLGIEIKDSTVYLMGVSRKRIPVLGQADVPILLGNTILPHKFLIIDDSSMNFPQGCTAILGANFLAGHSIIINTVTWSLYRDQEWLSEMAPALIEGKHYSAPSIVPQEYPPSSIPVPSTECQSNDKNPVNYTVGKLAQSPKRKRRSKDLSSTDRNDLTNTPSQKSGASLRHTYVNSQKERYLTSGNQYLVMPVASYQLKTGTTAVKVSLLCSKTSKVIKQSEHEEYMVEQNLFCPGVYISQTAISGKHLMVQVTNTLKSPVMLFRSVPIASAFELTEDSCEFFNLEIWDKDKYVPMDFRDETSRVVMTMYTLSEMTTPRAEDLTQGPDDLDKALEFDPREVNPEPPIYDEQRFQEIMSQIDTSLWEIQSRDKERLKAILRDKQRALYLKGEPLPATHLVEHEIVLKDKDAIAHTRPRWTPIRLRPFVESEVGSYLKLGLAYRTNSPHTSPIVLVRKKVVQDPNLNPGQPNKGQGQYRCCVDWRKLNSMTVDTYYPQRSIDDLLHKMALATYITCMDMPSAFYQLPLAKLSQLYSAFTTHFGAFALTRAGMGMKGSSYTLSMALDMALGHLRPNVDNYADDIFVASNSIDAHMSHIESTLQAFIDANMVVSPEKSKFFRTEVHVLGHTVGRGVIKPDHDKTEAIMRMSPPKNRTGVRSFLGLTSFFRRFISRYAHIAKPLTVLTSESVPFVWTQKEQEAFDNLKQKLCEGLFLRAPGHTKCWYIISDTSSRAVSAWLAQRHEGVLQTVTYHSYVLKECELKWTLKTYECETLIIYNAL